jgi:hypothetical protein
MFFDSFVKLTGDVMFRGATAPNPSNFYAILTSSTRLRTDVLSTVIADELAASNGYVRKLLNFSEGVYDGADKRYEFPNLTFTHTATGGDITYRSVIILADAIITVGNATGKLVAFSSEPSAVTILATQTKTFTIPVAVLNTGYILGV